MKQKLKLDRKQLLYILCCYAKRANGKGVVTREEVAELEKYLDVIMKELSEVYDLDDRSAIYE